MTRSTPEKPIVLAKSVSAAADIDLIYSAVKKAGLYMTKKLKNWLSFNRPMPRKNEQK
jgi:hypothetical protein